MNLLDPVKWGAQAAFAVTSTALKIGNNAVQTIELLLGRNEGDDEEHRYAPVATDEPSEAPVAQRDAARRRQRDPRPHRARADVGRRRVARRRRHRGRAGDAAAAARRTRPPRRSRRVSAPRTRSRRRRPSRASTTRGGARRARRDRGQREPGRDAPRRRAVGRAIDKLRAPEIAARVRESDAATKAVVRLYEQTHKKRKSILAATE
jgi:hypothetical protein